MDILRAWTWGQKWMADTDVCEIVRNVSMEAPDAFHHQQHMKILLQVLVSVGVRDTDAVAF